MKSSICMAYATTRQLQGVALVGKALARADLNDVKAAFKKLELQGWSPAEEKRLRNF